jgi:Flp pilus assembly pilin Flp
MKIFRRLWRDEAGFVISVELVLVATMLVMAMVVGLESVRDAVLTELADTATAIAQINQSYSYSGVTGHASSVSGSAFADATDFCDDTSSSTTTQNDAGTACVAIVDNAAANTGG